jgi:hypothetical protein
VFVLLIVWAFSVGYMATHAKREWVPHDEGALGLSAERVLHGELPHRDFDDYTGGLTFVHALAFRELGINSGTMRIVLFVFFISWVPAVFYVASRFTAAYSAGAVTLLSVAWSVPNYPGPMPSWYNLFFATFGTAALLRYVETTTRRWLFLAGLCAGLSFLAKVTAAYFVAGTLLFFIFREQAITNEENRRRMERARFYSTTIFLGLAVFIVLLSVMIRKVPGVGGLIYFVLPPFALVVLLASREFAGIAGQNRERFLRLMRMCLPFGMGIAIPVFVFLVPYVLSGSLHDLVHGLFAVPARAIHSTTFAPPNPFMMLTIIPIVIPVILGYECGRFGRAICGSIIASYGCALLVFSANYALMYSLGWCSLATAIPATILAGLAILCVSRLHQEFGIERQQQIFLIMGVTAMCSLVQFPFAAPVYFLYAAPLVILLAAALFASAPRPPRFALGAVIVFLLLFAALPITPYYLGIRHEPHSRSEELRLPRAGGLQVESSDAKLYEELIPLLQAHASGSFIYAAPDCPEVYFLSGLKSPTRHFFDTAEDTNGQSERTMKAIERLNVNVITINKHPQFSGPLSPDLQAALEQRYPNTTEVGTFQVRWRE